MLSHLAGPSNRAATPLGFSARDYDPREAALLQSRRPPDLTSLGDLNLLFGSLRTSPLPVYGIPVQNARAKERKTLMCNAVKKLTSTKLTTVDRKEIDYMVDKIFLRGLKVTKKGRQMSPSLVKNIALDTYTPPDKRTLILTDFSNGLNETSIELYSDLYFDYDQTRWNNVKMGNLSQLRDLRPERFEFILKNRNRTMTSNIGTKHMVRCDCTGEVCGERCPCVKESQGPIRLTQQGTHVINAHDFYDNAVQMCGALCKCQGACNNRVRFDRTMRFEVFKRHRDLGFCVRTLSHIRRGEILGEYVAPYLQEKCYIGDQISYRMAIEGVDARVKADVESGKLDKLILDPVREGNHLRFMCHSTFPNVEFFRVWEQNEYTGLVRLIAYAIESIPAGHELMFDYGEEYFDEGQKCLCKKNLCKDCFPLWSATAKILGRDKLRLIIERREIRMRAKMRMMDIYIAIKDGQLEDRQYEGMAEKLKIVIKQKYNKNPEEEVKFTKLELRRLEAYRTTTWEEVDLAHYPEAKTRLTFPKDPMTLPCGPNEHREPLVITDAMLREFRARKAEKEEMMMRMEPSAASAARGGGGGEASTAGGPAPSLMRGLAEMNARKAQRQARAQQQMEIEQPGPSGSDMRY